MRELSLNILDIAQNSLSASATLVSIKVALDSKGDTLTIAVEDNGKGMDRELLDRVTDPFSTTRTTRKVGMGIPLFKQAAEMTGGSFKITSEKGRGTVVKAIFKLSSIDRMPMGDLAGTVSVLAQNPQNADITLDFSADGRNFLFDTREIKRELESPDITAFEVVNFIREYLEENINSISGGMVL